MLGVYSRIKKAVNNDGVESVSVAELSNDVTPMIESAKRISMKDEFSGEQFVANVVENLRQQDVNFGLRLSSQLWRRIVRACDERMERARDELTSQLFFQLLLVLSKMDPDEYFASVKDYFPDKDVAYESLLSVCLMNFETHFATAFLVDEAFDSKVKTFIKRAPVVRAARFCLLHVFGQNKCDTISMKWIRTNVDAMRIYMVESMGPLKGVALRDGVLLSRQCLSHDPPQVAALYDAGLFTLIIHEACHYLARLFADDFNFSTPFKSKFGDEIPSPPRQDTCLTGKTVELGRYVELVLFDGIQPSWVNSFPKAAEAFLTRIEQSSYASDELKNGSNEMKDSSRPPPVLDKSEHEQLVLVAREPSVSFDADLMEPPSISIE